MKPRRNRDSRIVPGDEAVKVVQQGISELEAELAGRTRDGDVGV